MTDSDDQLMNGIVTALITPFARDGGLDLRAWQGLINEQLQAGTHGLVVAGTTGESATLSKAERDQLLRQAVDQVNGRIPVLAGTGSASTADVIASNERAAALGADAVLVVAPYYNRPPQAGLIAHYSAIADASPVPVMLYNVPGRTVTDLLPETTIALADHPNVMGIKEAVADQARVQTLLDAGVHVLSGDDPSALEALRRGAAGVISVIANLVPDDLVAMYNLVQAGQLEQARARMQTLEPLLAFLSIQTNPIPAKWLLAEMGRIQPGLRLPLVPLDLAHHAQGHRVLESLLATEATPRRAYH
ncbi:MAG: 4-hydroxy-tetrahydrodipicolinate synthase [Pseudomonadota bacterium]